MNCAFCGRDVLRWWVTPLFPRRPSLVSPKPSLDAREEIRTCMDFECRALALEEQRRLGREGRT